MQPEVENGCEKAIHAITYGVNGPGIWLDWMRWRQGIAAGFTASSVSGAIAYEVTRYDIGELDRAIADGDARGFVKVLTPPGSDRILGVTIVGAHAGDLIAEFTLVMKYKLRLNKDPGHHSYLPDLGRSKQVFGRRLAACPCLQWVGFRSCPAPRSGARISGPRRVCSAGWRVTIAGDARADTGFGERRLRPPHASDYYRQQFS